MRSKSTRLPKYRHYKPKDLAVVRIDGKDHNLGKFGSEESQQKYRRLIAEMLAATATAQPPTPQPNGDGGPTLNELLVSYWNHVRSYYVEDGRPTSEQDNLKQALRFVQPLYGPIAAKDFSPLALKAVRRAMIEAGRCRRLINKDVCRVRSMFRWAIEHELVPLATYQALMTVAARMPPGWYPAAMTWPSGLRATLMTTPSFTKNGSSPRSVRVVVSQSPTPPPLFPLRRYPAASVFRCARPPECSQATRSIGCEPRCARPWPSEANPKDSALH
jgi:hypothetical protein